MVPFESNPNLAPIEIDDTTTAGLTYVRYVNKGSTTDDNAQNCAIQCIDETGATTKILWAEGTTEFIFTWGNRAAITYLPLKK